MIKENTFTDKCGNTELLTYCKQIHDGVAGLSKEGLSESHTEQWARIDCKTQCSIITRYILTTMLSLLNFILFF